MTLAPQPKHAGGRPPKHADRPWEKEGCSRRTWERRRRARMPAGDVAPPPQFQQAKNPAGTSPFLQIVAKPDPQKLTRVAFKVSRLMEFCTARELMNQTGHHVDEWPLVIAKELIDNALDAAEEAEVAPIISVVVEPGAIIIEDNAGG